jgi:hypothetical protein
MTPRDFKTCLYTRLSLVVVVYGLLALVEVMR